MTLHYHFEEMPVLEVNSESWHTNHNAYEPHYHTEYCNVDYDYEVDITDEDIKGWNGTIDELEEDEDFIEYMTNKYYDDAWNACKKEYND